MEITVKISQLKTALTACLKSVSTACLLWSGGADSTLLLYVLRSMQAPVDLLQWSATFTGEQKALCEQIINKLSLRVFSYQPANSYLLGEGEEITLVEEYTVGHGHTIPIFRDIVAGSRCALEVGYRQFNCFPPILFELYLTGARASDSHYAMNGRVCPQPSFSAPGAQICAPLFDWTRSEVIAALKLYEPDYTEPKDAVNTGNLAVCSLCLSGERRVFCPKQQQTIDGVLWQPKEMLAAFRAKYQVMNNPQPGSLSAESEL